MDDNGMSRYMEKRLNSESRVMLALAMPSREGGRVNSIMMMRGGTERCMMDDGRRKREETHDKRKR